MKADDSVDALKLRLLTSRAVQLIDFKLKSD